MHTMEVREKEVVRQTIHPKHIKADIPVTEGTPTAFIFLIVVAIILFLDSLWDLRSKK